MRASLRRSIRRGRFAAVAVVGALALAAPIAGANAATNPFSFWSGAAAPFAYPSFSAAAFPIAQQGSVGGAVLSQPIAGTTAVTGCGESRQELLGSGSTLSNTSCYSVLSFIGPSIGQINSQVGPTIIGSVILAPVTVSAGPVVNTVP
jgi:hypothetical protein